MSSFPRALLIGCWLACGIAFPAAGRAAELKVGGTGSATQLLEILSKELGKEHGVAVEVVPSLGTSGGLRALADGALDVSVSGRALSAAEQAQGLGVRLTVRTPFVLVTSHASPNGLRKAEAVAAFGSEKVTWRDGTPVRIVLRPRVESDIALLRRYFPHMDVAIEKARSRPDIPVAATDQDNLAMAERIAGSLTAATLTQVALEKRNLRLITIDDVEPTFANFERGSYPYAKELLFVARLPASPAVEAFIDFLKSPRGKAILRSGYIL